ncbi:substrate-binding domain-containing protein [Vicingaceae bacterium]|nr:substrate-binding domain-containing protein [Vicingaceae bacterium]
MIKLRLGGVPEHFNLPIHLASERGDFKKVGIEIDWTDFGGGTGEMTKALRNNEVDICILLTEGIILDIINGNQTKIISEYVSTPLCWGIHTSISNPISEYSQIYNKQYAISRNGSGSHLMAQIDANGQNIELKESQFEIIKNLDGALASLKNLETDVFYWEKFTTKPYVDAGLLKRIGEFPTPWPSFMIAASDNILDKHPDLIALMLDVIHASCENFMENSSEVIPQVSERYKLKLKDSENWFHRTEWAVDGWVSDKMLQSVIYNLKLANILEDNKSIPELIWKR